MYEKSENKKMSNIFFVTNKFSVVILFRHLLVLFKNKKKRCSFSNSFAAHILNIMTKIEKERYFFLNKYFSQYFYSFHFEFKSYNAISNKLRLLKLCFYLGANSYLKKMCESYRLQ